METFYNVFLMRIKALLEWPGSLRDGPEQPKVVHVRLPNSTGRFFTGCVALFHIPVTEMHLHKVLIWFEGRGGVIN